MGEPAEAPRDERLANILAELTAELRAGGQPDVDAVARRHPDLADELAGLWAAAQIAEEFTSASGQRDAAGGAAQLPIVADYELLQEIGRGGMGVVYKARDRTLDRTIALKMVLRGNLAVAADLDRFRAEAESAARLTHPHIVPVFDFGEADGGLYFSMPFIEGTTLARLVADGPLLPRDAAVYLAPVCRAVQYAHEHGIVHRDLKPSNVLIDREGRPYVTDFGLAKRIGGAGPRTQTGAVLGTPSYMAPEQAAGGRSEVGPAADIYALGAILYELLTGRPPFQAPTHLETLRLLVEQEPVAPRLLNPGVDRDLEMVCLKCLQKPPDLRYRSAGELAADLEAYLAGEPVSARSSGLAYRVGKLLSPTHHADVLENWGLLWMWHSLAVLVLCAVTNVLWLRGVRNTYPYLGLWVFGLGSWACIFLALRRRGGPVTFIERQIVHVWTGSTLGTMALFGIERLLGLGVLTLSPVLGILGGMVFLVKASMLSGWFYIPAAGCFAASAFMAFVPDYGLFAFGLVSAAGFFFPGLKYYRQQLRAQQRRVETEVT